jgi:hypothetical protein
VDEWGIVRMMSGYPEVGMGSEVVMREEGWTAVVVADAEDAVAAELLLWEREVMESGVVMASPTVAAVVAAGSVAPVAAAVVAASVVVADAVVAAVIDAVDVAAGVPAGFAVAVLCAFSLVASACSRPRHRRRP